MTEELFQEPVTDSAEPTESAGDVGAGEGDDSRDESDTGTIDGE